MTRKLSPPAPARNACAIALLCGLALIAIACRNAAAEHFNRGIELTAQGDYDGAIAAYSTAVSIDPDDADAYYNRGILHYGKGDYDSAFADFDTAIRLDPDDIDQYTFAGSPTTN